MLLLGRKVGESLFIGTIQIKVIAIDRGVVRLGIAAPDDVPVLREELMPRDGSVPQRLVNKEHP